MPIKARMKMYHDEIYIYCYQSNPKYTQTHIKRCHLYIYMAVGYGNGAGFPEYLPNPTPNGKGLG